MDRNARTLDDQDRRRLREAMVAHIRAGKPNPFEPSSPAHVAFAFTKELLGHAERAPDSALGRRAHDVMRGAGTATDKPDPATPPLPGSKPPAPLRLEDFPSVAPIDPVSCAFADAIAGLESRAHGYRETNAGSSALGRYQMLNVARQTVGLLDGDHRWTGALGIDSDEEFRDSPYAQDIAFAAYMRALRRELGPLRDGTPSAFDHVGQALTLQNGETITITEAGILAAAHQEGSMALRLYLAFAGSADWSTDGASFPTERVVQSAKRTQSEAFPQIERRLALFDTIPYRRNGPEFPALVVPLGTRRQP